MLPLVYIILVNWNGKRDTLECLESLRSISYSNFKILVVDNASNDGSVEAIRQQFQHVEVICNKENLRFAGGNNVGILHALKNSADYVLLLNNDTVVKKNFLSELINIAESDTTIGMTCSKIYYYFDKQLLWFAGGVIE